MKFIRKKINEGFVNPFEDSVTDTLSSTAIQNADVVSDPLYSGGNKDNVKIDNVKLWNTNTSNKVVYKSSPERMCAGQYFCIGDIVETCPVRLLSDEDMYSKNIRNCCFTIDKGKGVYALPLGYALCYRNSMQLPNSNGGNIEYEFDSDNNEIIFTAIRNIRKGEELVISATEDDFANEIQPGQFQYKQGPDPIYSTKNIILI